MSEQPEQVPGQLSLDDDMPVDPNAHDYDDSDEGAAEDGTPVTSVHGSEQEVWADDVPEADEG